MTFLPPPPNVTPEQLKEISDFGFKALKADTQNLQGMNRYIRCSYAALFAMYCTLFVIGLGSAAATVIKGFVATNPGDAIPALVTAGLSAASFFTIFITRPLESLERNAIFSSWLVAAVSAYWTRLMYFGDPKTVNEDIEHATNDFVQTLSNLADKYAVAYGKYATPPSPQADTTYSQQPGEPQPPGNS